MIKLTHYPPRRGVDAAATSAYRSWYLNEEASDDRCRPDG